VAPDLPDGAARLPRHGGQDREVLGVREEGIRVKDFVDRHDWPAVKTTLAPVWAERSISTRYCLPYSAALSSPGSASMTLSVGMANGSGSAR